MDVSLTPELETLVQGKVASGSYESVSEVIREGLRLIQERDALQQLRLEALRWNVRRSEYTEYASGAEVAARIENLAQANGRAATQAGTKTKTKPGRYTPKAGGKLSGGKASVTAPVLSAEMQILTANRLFREQVEKIADAHVSVRAGDHEWEPVYIVQIPEYHSKAFDEVVTLHGDLYRKYPKSILNVKFRPKRELEEAAKHRDWLTDK